MSIRNFRRCLASLIALAAAGCATTTFESTWKAPDAKPLQFQAGDRIVAMVVSDQVSIRRSGEANLADVLDGRGFKAVPAYTLIPEEEVHDEAKAKARIEAANVVGVVVLRPRGSEQKVTTTGGSYGPPYYGGFWGGGYYYNSWYAPPVTRTDTYVAIETLIYDLRQNKLVWAGRSKTMNPKDVEAFVGELAVAVAGELRKAGLIAGK
jgi:hypothetical protein